MRRASEPSEVVSLTAATLSSLAVGRAACCGLSSVASTTGSNDRRERRIPREGLARRCRGLTAAASRQVLPQAGWKPASESRSTSASLLVCSSSQASMTWPTRFACAPSRPGWPSSASARRLTQRSQRIPLTWIISCWTTCLGYRALDEVGAEGCEPVPLPDLELMCRLVLERRERLQQRLATQLARRWRDEVEELRRELPRGHDA